MEAQSAFGGSADSQARDGETSAWPSRPVLSGLIRLGVFIVPLASALLMVRATAGILPAPDTVLGWVGWAIGTAAIALATVTVVERVTRRALPLAAMLRLSLVFPDETPSRMRVALRTGTAKDLERRVAEGGSLGDTASEAATNLLILLRRLNEHDRLTRGHSERVRAYSDVIAEQMGLADADRQKLHWAALAHDLGKLTVPPEILNSPGRPTDAEWEVLRGHPAAAATIVEPLRPWLGDWLTAATQHHERWDGRGYPAALAGKDIHLSGRIVAVADAFDTMTSARSYKKPLALADARAELTRNAGSQFDPSVVRAFMAVSIGRLRLVAGPLSWLTSIPTASGVTSVVTGGGTATVATSIASVAAVVATSVGLGMQVPSVMDESAAGFADQQTESVVVDELAYWEDTSVSSTVDKPVTPVSSITTVPSSTTSSAITTTISATAQTTTSIFAPTTTARAQPTTTATTAAPTTTATTAKPTTTATTAANQGADCADVQGGRRPLANLDLFNCDLGGFDLAGVSFNGAELDGANFSGANLSGATIRDADVEGANFDGANLTGADMRFSGWDFSSFVGAVLSGANLRDSDAESIDFTGADLTSTILGDTNIAFSNFTNANLTDSTGKPNDGPLSIWSNTTCSNGDVQSSTCYSD